MESRKSFCCAQSLCAHRKRTKREHALTSLQSAIENLKSKMSAVPVVQRIEQGFPNSHGFPSHEGSKSCWSRQKASIPVSDGHLSGNKWRRPKSPESNE